ncbi:MAG: hypothetical protein KKA73_19155 [Chloroflexi bacterium]|nr:hypothetical protein [Chloroflexota bacterium]MBU1749807.1 hypothetical protein [Chloroflexota bacterium]
MESVTLQVPALWADHHTLVVHALLAGMAGVDDVYASAKNKQVTLAYDPGQIDLAAIEKALAQAGYPVGATAQVVEQGFVWRKASEWAVVADRVTETALVDLQMSGDHRKY